MELNKFQLTKLAEVTLYIVNKVGGLGKYHIFKTLYFAQRMHLVEWGCPIVDDEFQALQYGPVPRFLCKGVREITKKGSFLNGLLKKGGDDASNLFLAVRPADMSFISKSEQGILDKAIEQYASKSFNELLELSHKKAWRETMPKAVISPIKIAEEGGADEAMLEYISEQLNFTMS